MLFRSKPENLCVDVVGGLPRCMDMIPAAEVVRRIELYFQGGAIRYLTPHERDLARSAILASRPSADNSVAAPRAMG